MMQISIYMRNQLNSNVTSASKNRGIECYFILLFVSLCLQYVILFQIGGVNIKLGHIIALISSPLLLLPEVKIKLPSLQICIFALLLVIVSLFDGFVWGIDTLLFNYLFNFYLIMIVMTFGSSLNVENWLKIIRISGFAMLVIVLTNCVIHREKIFQFYHCFSGDGHPVFPTIFGGGVNLEATWLSMFAFFFIESRFGFAYLFFSVLVSMLLASRVGILICFICLLWMIYVRKKAINHLVLVVMVLGVTAVVAAFSKSAIAVPLLTRMLEIGTDKGSLGRLNMWQYIGATIAQNPLGCGIGNIMLAIEKVSNAIFVEGNLHNLYLQMFIELGWVGGLFFTGLVVCFFYRQFRYRHFCSPFDIYLTSFFILALVQFRAVEVLPCFILGIYLLDPKRETVNEYQS